MTPREDNAFQQARASIRRAIARQSYVRSQWQTAQSTELQAAAQAERTQLKSALNKLDEGTVRIAAFGLVSRGKSAVLNALMGQKMFTTGPTHGVTKWPRSVRWKNKEDAKVQVELIDTPGLDEIEGVERAEMAKDVARQADLILFVVAGDITNTEYQALSELWQTRKPLILVFNKIDLYPDRDREAIYKQLQALGQRTGMSLRPDEIVRVAAEPMPLQVRVEWPDGRVSYETETPPSQVDELKQTILEILNREGRSLLALNALIQARDAQSQWATQSVELCAGDAETLIWKYTRYKAAAVALNPVAVLDVFGGAIADLALIRSLARLYGLPMTSYEAGKLWKTILWSSGGLLAGEFGSNMLLGLGKSTAGLGTSLPGYASAAIAQAAVAGYGAYAVGRVAQVYLERGCTWGEDGPDTTIQAILDRVDRDTILSRLKQELRRKQERSSDRDESRD